MNDEAMAGRGRRADTPTQIPMLGWKDILWRLKERLTNDRVSLIAAGIAFFLFVAMFPALAAFVSVYGLVADPATIEAHLETLGAILPTGVIDVVRTEVQRIADQTESTLGVALLVSVLLAVWSANKGTLALFEGLNFAYQERERRGIVRKYATSLLFTAVSMTGILVLMAAIAGLPALVAALDLGSLGKWLVTGLTWIGLAVAGLAGLAAIYRYGPSREDARWEWISWGSVLTLCLILLTSLLLSWYLANFADYNKTYGSLGALIGLLMWMWIMVVLVLLGGELNAEVEHQTSRDTTTGPPQPMGRRGATMADTMGRASR